ncbi:MAG: winged helix-turn-helix transcriptional regulator [Oligoflexia bacterium]|nr:winged helix-turn-helix transcriptional regulator [Oligoflexia bacterium]
MGNEKDFKKTYKRREKIMKAMAHASRLVILDSLYKTEKCVCELVDLVGDDPSTVSKHLSVLKNAGIVDDDKRGLKVFYKLTCPCVIEYIDCIEKVVRKNSKELWG